MNVTLFQRFPQIDLSYETDAHKKVLTNKYDLCVSIPTGKKSFAWFTYKPGTAIDACYIADTKVTKFTEVKLAPFEFKLTLQTIIYGTICELNSKKFFVIEDMFFYCGLPVKQMPYGDKMTYMHQMLSKYLNQTPKCEMIFTLPYLRKMNNDTNDILSNPIFYDEMISKTAYLTHHVQFRSSVEILPYLNHNYKKTATKTLDENNNNLTKDFVMRFPRKDIDYAACAQKHEAVFQVMADIESDIYHLYCYDGKNQENPHTYLDISYIGTRKESVFMNNLFRNIRENSNIDLGEESEDEETFQNTNLDKYVDLEKTIKMNCIFSEKWRKWVPMHVVADSSRIANVNELTRRQGNVNNSNLRTPYSNNGNARTPYSNNGNARTPYPNNNSNLRTPYSNNGNARTSYPKNKNNNARTYG